VVSSSNTDADPRTEGGIKEVRGIRTRGERRNFPLTSDDPGKEEEDGKISGASNNKSRSTAFRESDSPYSARTSHTSYSGASSLVSRAHRIHTTVHEPRAREETARPILPRSAELLTRLPGLFAELTVEETSRDLRSDLIAVIRDSLRLGKRWAG
jgi:hypothetical protein